jgi:hypothetical protein
MCNSNKLIELLNLGLQPLSNHYLNNKKSEENKYPLILFCCNDCGLIQKKENILGHELCPNYNWISYNEPEMHINDVIKIISDLQGVNHDSLFLGISYKDDTLLNKLFNNGFSNIYRIDSFLDLNIENECAGIETIQEKIHPLFIKDIINKIGIPNVIVARHILEHANDLSLFITTLLNNIADMGYLIFEVPDCLVGFKTFNYNMIWEEHSQYYIEKSFKNIFSYFGLKLIDLINYPYFSENSLVGIAQKDNKIHNLKQYQKLSNVEREIYIKYSNNFEKMKKQYRKKLYEISKNGKIVLYGSGHSACAFLNYFQLGEFFSYVVDDNPKKHGFFLPGSKLEIRSASSLITDGIGYIVLCVNPEIENNIIRKNKPFIEMGGTYYSTFNSSAISLINE